MILEMPWRDFLALFALALGLVSFLPYLWQILKRKTQPHAYTWLIWTITQDVVAAGVWFGGGGHVQALAMVAYAVCAFIVFVLCFWYGTKNITRGDTVLLIIALGSIGIWLGLDNPVLAIIVATSIDIIGYLPTFRKSYFEPFTENILAWIGYALTPIIVLFSLYEYNLMTATYATATAIINTVLVAFLYVRRAQVRKSK